MFKIFKGEIDQGFEEFIAEAAARDFIEEVMSEGYYDTTGWYVRNMD